MSVPETTGHTPTGINYQTYYRSLSAPRENLPLLFHVHYISFMTLRQLEPPEGTLLCIEIS